MSFFNKLINKPKLGEYQKRKLLFDFQTFFGEKDLGIFVSLRLNKFIRVKGCSVVLRISNSISQRPSSTELTDSW